MANFWKKPNFVSSSIKFYDFLVNDINCNYAWRCNKSNIFNLYKNNIKSNHLEIGPGSGYFLMQNDNLKIRNLYLMDINQPILNESKKNLELKYSNTQVINHDIFKKPIKIENLESVGINYVLHCVPGNLEYKFENLLKNLPTNVNIFGATVINDSDKQTSLSQAELYFLNSKGIFNNNQDYSEDFLNFMLNQKINFNHKIIGNVLIFEIKV